MRYKVDEIPKEQLAYHASDNMLILTSVVGFFIGFVLFYLGRKGKQMYLWVWGIGLSIFSFYLGISIYFDWTLFEHF